MSVVRSSDVCLLWWENNPHGVEHFAGTEAHSNRGCMKKQMIVAS